MLCDSFGIFRGSPTCHRFECSQGDDVVNCFLYSCDTPLFGIIWEKGVVGGQEDTGRGVFEGKENYFKHIV